MLRLRDERAREVRDVRVARVGDPASALLLSGVVRDERLEPLRARREGDEPAAPRLEEAVLSREREAANPGLEVEDGLLEAVRRPQHLLGVAREPRGAAKVDDGDEEEHEDGNDDEPEQGTGEGRAAG